ncbi:Uncharacterised protein [uncultured archaeon]|nr:Uncharacterised protein [uncultured archaeon]
MGEYEDTLEDIESTLGIVPGFMKAIPACTCKGLGSLEEIFTR